MLTILVPLDGSALAEQVLPYVAQLAPLLDAQIQLLRVIPARAPALELIGAGPQDLLDAAVPNQEQSCVAHALQQCAWQLRAAGLNVTADVRYGSPPACIRAVAEQLPEALLALSVNGCGGFERQVAGHVTEAVVHSINVPMLLIHGAAYQHSPWRVRRILVPLADGSSTQRALPYAVRIARATGAELLLLRMVTTPGWIESSASPMDWTTSPSSPELAEAVVVAHTETSAITQRLSREGVAATPIVVHETDVPLLLVPAYGRG